jgi:hypothetical protein
MSMHPLNTHHSSLTLGVTCVWDSNPMKHHLTWRPSMSSRTGWHQPWKRQNQHWQRQKTTWHSTTTAAALQHWCTRSETWCTCTPKTSAPPGHLRNLHTAILHYKVEKCVGTHAYRLKLPAAMSRLHPVFHVVKLLPALQDPIPGRQPTAVPEPELIDGEEHYEVEEILDS